MRSNRRNPLLAGAGRMGVGLVMAAVLSAGVTGYVGEKPHPRLSVAVMPTAAIVESSTTLGISDSSLLFATPAEIEKTFQEMQALGVQNIRIQIPWAGVEIADDTYVWQAIDKQVDLAEKYGMGILGVINQTPRWAGAEWASHPDPAEFAEFTGEVARRYKGEIYAYEIWNEPNSVQFFDPIDPAAYTQLLQASYPVIKGVDPSITVIGGVLGAVIGQGRLVLNPVRFAEQMFEAGAAGSFDALSFHPYQYTLKFSEGDPQLASPKRQVEAIRLLMQQYGVGGLPIWATEYGLPTPTGNVDEQAAFIADFLAAWQKVEQAGPMFIYTMKDFVAGSTSDQDNFGIFYANWTAKPAAGVIKDFIDLLKPDHPILDAIRAAVRALAQATGDLIRFGAEVVENVVGAVIDVTRFVVDTTIDVVAAVVKTTAEVVESVVRFGVDLVRAGVDIVRGVVDRIVTAVTNCFASAGLVAPARAGVADTNVQFSHSAAEVPDSAANRTVAQRDVQPVPSVGAESSTGIAANPAGVTVVADTAVESAGDAEVLTAPLPVDAEPVRESEEKFEGQAEVDTLRAPSIADRNEGQLNERQSAARGAHRDASENGRADDRRRPERVRATFGGAPSSHSADSGDDAAEANSDT